jgi:hypothetical protein
MTKDVQRYRKKPVVIEAIRWFQNGDHPEDGTDIFTSGEFVNARCEGKVVRYFRRPDVDGETPCRRCAVRMHEHGWIDTPEGGHIVCPGDWIIKGVQGEFYPCKPHIFETNYEPVG